MIKAICDKCGKEFTLVYSEYGLESPSGWNLKAGYIPLKRGYDYRTFCPECSRKVKNDRIDVEGPDMNAAYPKVQ